MKSVYGWDNEFGFHQAQIDCFEINERLISNKDFLKFMVDGGYAKKSLWSAEGWKWVEESKSTMPKWWIHKHPLESILTKQFVTRLMLSETETMPWSWPVEVNCHEATAYTVWLTAKTGKYTRLPTEDESYYLFKESCFDEDSN